MQDWNLTDLEMISIVGSSFYSFAFSVYTGKLARQLTNFLLRFFLTSFAEYAIKTKITRHEPKLRLLRLVANLLYNVL